MKTKKSGIPYPNKSCGIPGSRKYRKKKKIAGTPGFLKAGCGADMLARAVCRKSRSYKWDNYEELMRGLGKRKASK